MAAQDGLQGINKQTRAMDAAGLGLRQSTQGCKQERAPLLRRRSCFPSGVAFLPRAAGVHIYRGIDTGCGTFEASRVSFGAGGRAKAAGALPATASLHVRAQSPSRRPVHCRACSTGQGARRYLPLQAGDTDAVSRGNPRQTACHVRCHVGDRMISVFPTNQNDLYRTR